MALPEKQPSADIDHSVVIEFVPLPPALPVHSAVEEMEDERPGPGFLTGKGRSVGRLCGEAQRVVVERIAQVAFRLRNMRSRAEMRVRSLKQEDPLRLLGIIGAGAFVCGVVARVWRSESYESRRK
jgi:hypothetical protein